MGLHFFLIISVPCILKVVLIHQEDGNRQLCFIPESVLTLCHLSYIMDIFQHNFSSCSEQRYIQLIYLSFLNSLSFLVFPIQLFQFRSCLNLLWDRDSVLINFIFSQFIVQWHKAGIPEILKLWEVSLKSITILLKSYSFLKIFFEMVRVLKVFVIFEPFSL